MLPRSPHFTFFYGDFLNGEWGYFVAALTLALVIKALVSTTLVGKAGALGVHTALTVEGLALQRLGAEEQNDGEQSVEELSVGEQSAGERSGEAVSANDLSAKGLGT